MARKKRNIRKVNKLSLPDPVILIIVTLLLLIGIIFVYEASVVEAYSLPSESLTKPISQTLSKTWTPLRLQARAVDAARVQVYEDQKMQLRNNGVSLCEVRAENQTRVGPKKLELGKQAFEQARKRARQELAGHKWC